MLETATRSPPTARARLARSVVVATRRSLACASAGSETAMHATANHAMGIAARIGAASTYFGVFHRLFGIRQWTFFSVSDTAPTRQSIATLARP